jgi:hypothetical protein
MPINYGGSWAGNSGQFGGSPYNNPQMSQFGGSQVSGGGYGYGGYNVPAPQGTGCSNPNAADTQWRMSMVPSAAQWRGPAPGHHGQSASYNPDTGQVSWENTSGGTGITGGSSPYGRDVTSWIDPETGIQMSNPYVGARTAMSIARQLGLDVNGGFQPQQYEMTAYSGPQVSAPGGYEGFDYDAIGSGIDPSAVIAAQEYKLQEAMEGDMARAGGRMGQSGFAMSTPYANELGQAARKAAQDRNAITMQYQYDAAQQQAARDLAQQLQAGQHDFGGWQTQGGWDMQGQLANQNQAIQQWMLQNQMGMSNTDMQNQYGMQNQNMQQQMLASILGGLF